MLLWVAGIGHWALLKGVNRCGDILADLFFELFLIYYSFPNTNIIPCILFIQKKNSEIATNILSQFSSYTHCKQIYYIQQIKQYI